MNSFLRKQFWLPRKTSICLTHQAIRWLMGQPSRKEGHAVSQVSATWRSSLPGDFLLVPYKREHLISPRLPSPTSGDRVCRPEPQSPWDWHTLASDLKKGRWTETPTEGVLCLLGLTRMLSLGLAQSLNSSLEMVLVVDMVSHFSETGDYTVLSKL